MRQRRDRHEHRRHVDALAIAERAAGDHFAIRKIAIPAQYLDPQLAVVEQDVCAHLDGSEDLRMRQGDSRLVAQLLRQIETEGVAPLQIDLTLRKAPDAQLRALQIL